MAGYLEIIAGTGGIMNCDIWATVDEQLHEYTPELGKILTYLVMQKTPVLTGALQGDMTYEAYTSPGGYGMGSDLVYIYATGDFQQAVWNRIYVWYQEGEPLGAFTITNAPRMFFVNTALGDGRQAAMAWAQLAVSIALGLCAAGAGVPL